MQQEFLIQGNEVCKSFGAFIALDKVSFQIPKQSVFGLLGPNGAGKTTLIRILTQITKADTGIVTMDGRPILEDDIYKMGYLPEERGLYKKMEVAEQLIYLARLKGLSRPEAVTRLKSWFEKLDLTPWWKKKVEELSKGMQQKVQFIATVIHEPSLIILDEPFTGFDPVNANLIKDEILKLRQNGATIIFSSHRMESVEEMCDHIMLVAKGKKVLDGSIPDVRAQYRTDTWLLTTDKAITAPTDAPYELLQTRNDASGTHSAILKLKPGATGNQLLGHVLPQANVVKFEERLPSIADIFISIVTHQPITVGFTSLSES